MSGRPRAFRAGQRCRRFCRSSCPSKEVHSDVPIRDALCTLTDGWVVNRPLCLSFPLSAAPHGRSLMPARPVLDTSAVPSSLAAVRAAFLTVKDAAEYLGLSPHTLYVWRHRRQGPPSFRMGPRGRVMYRQESLDAWICEQEQADSRSNTALSPLKADPRHRASRMLSA
ncbi:helix-turn-helix domain-containing protein [Streptomyces sp. NPDC051644]|uniref:helix-turn-helix domain-containing protein n=1 Tax=Streptomyces sp. NPDC051644 TaxID=3365666 RepID=UPI0037910F17